MELFFRAPTSREASDLNLPSDGSHHETLAVEYLKKTFEAPERARSRAQIGYTIVGTLGAAYIGTALLSGFTVGSPLATTIAVIAAVMWTTTICLYLNTATASQPDDTEYPEDSPRNWQSFVRNALNDMQNERANLVWKLRRANILAVASTTAAVLSITIGILPEPKIWSEVHASLSDEAQQYIASICQTNRRISMVSLDKSDLQNHYITITSIEHCNHETQISVPRRWLVAFSEQGR
jgi:hypothetical protein